MLGAHRPQASAKAAQRPAVTLVVTHHPTVATDEEAVLEAYALIHHEHHGTELAALLHRGEHVARAQQHLSDVIRDLLAEAADSGDLRDDVAPAELASYCLHALTAAGSLPSKAAVRRLVTVTLAGLRPAPAGSRHGR